jgi:hypothetical protein
MTNSEPSRSPPFFLLPASIKALCLPRSHHVTPAFTGEIWRKTRRDNAADPARTGSRGIQRQGHAPSRLIPTRDHARPSPPPALTRGSDGSGKPAVEVTVI